LEARNYGTEEESTIGGTVWRIEMGWKRALVIVSQSLVFNELLPKETKGDFVSGEERSGKA